VAILEKGLIHVYTGPGKGKTTAALGLAWRMLGRAGAVYICQFLKPADQITGETLWARKFSEKLTLERLETDWNMRTSEKDPRQFEKMRHAIAEKLTRIRKIVQEGKFDLVILDEIVLCLKKDLARPEDVYDIIQHRADHVELVLTGRGADAALIEKADLVTYMQEIKHPYRQGAPARGGIEY